jgi:hypothetical protein
MEHPVVDHSLKGKSYHIMSYHGNHGVENPKVLMNCWATMGKLSHKYDPNSDMYI